MADNFNNSGDKLKVSNIGHWGTNQCKNMQAFFLENMHYDRYSHYGNSRVKQRFNFHKWL